MRSIALERTAKGRRRLRSILRAYVAARHIERVRYYVSSHGHPFEGLAHVLLGHRLLQQPHGPEGVGVVIEDLDRDH